MDRSDAARRLVTALRQVNVERTLFGQTVAIRLGLSDSDVEALEWLLEAGASTAGRLSELTGLTSGAVTRVIDRLEQAGYVRRTADPGDRRRVVVEIVPERLPNLEAMLGPVGRAGAGIVASYSDEELRIIDGFLARMAEATRGEAARMRDPGGAAAEPGPAADHVAPVGGLTAAHLLLRSGLNELTLRGDTGLGELYRARFEGPVPRVRLRDGTVTVHYGSEGMPWNWRKRKADITLNAAIAWSIALTGGSARLDADLRDVPVRAFDLTGGSDRVHLVFGRPAGDVRVRMIGGTNEVRIERPAGVAVRLTVSGGSGGIELDGRRTGGVGGVTTLDTPGAEAAVGRYFVEITGGSSRIVVGPIA